MKTQQLDESKGHLMFADDSEYFAVGTDVYRVPASAPIGASGYRLGARWESELWHWEWRKAHAVYPFVPAFAA
jgi:hypothetical protein